MEKNLKNIRQQFKEQGVFYTSSELAEILKGYVPFRPKKVYDPTCGSGNLLKVFDDDILKYGQELDETQVEIARKELKNFIGYVGDTLKDDKFANEKFDCIVANYPFSIKWEPNKNDVRFKDCKTLAPPSKADYAFLQHIIYHLEDNGIAVCLNFPGIAYRGNAEGKIRQWFIDNNFIERVVNIPEKTFIDTSIATLLLVLRKNKSNTNITFEDKESGAIKEVSYEEVKKHNYNLSVNTYIETETKKEEIDIDKVNKSIVDNIIKEIENILKCNRTIEQFFGEDNFHTDYLIEKLKEIIKEYERV